MFAPPDWNLVAVSGDRSRGYFRADGPEACGVEARWVSQATKPDLRAKLDKYLNDLARAAKKRRAAFSSKTKDRKPTPTEDRSGGISLSFTWKADRSAYGRIMWCGECKRLVIAQVVGPLNQDLSGISAEILNSICTHEAPGWSLWGMYGFAAAIPDGYRMLRHMLMSSYLQLVFSGREGELTVERWGLAETLTREKGLEGWYSYEYRPENSGFACSQRPGETHGHEALEVSGKRRLSATIGHIPRILRGRGTPSRLLAKVWLCPEGNRIYSVRLLHKRNPAILDEVVDRLECH